MFRECSGIVIPPFRYLSWFYPDFIDMAEREIDGSGRKTANVSSDIPNLMAAHRTYTPILDFVGDEPEKSGLKELLIPKRLARIVGGMKNINVFKMIDHVVVSDAKQYEGIKEAALSLQLYTFERPEGETALFFEHALRDLKKDEVTEMEARQKLYPGQRRPGLPADLNDELVRNIIKFARKLGYSHVGIGASYYHIYQMARMHGFKPEFDESKWRIEDFESTHGKESKTLRELSWLACDEDVFASCQMVLDLRSKKKSR
jgi:hypothetical protein